MESSENKSRHKLEGTVSKEVTKMFESILDYAQVAVPSKETFQVLRSRILRSGNDCIRNICTGLDSYKIKYESNAEDVVEILTKKQRK